MTSADDFIGGLVRGEMAADNFFIMTNAAARDRTLHLADRGLLADMMSHKNGFVITEETLAARCMDGVKTIRTCLRRLRAAGYVYRGERLRYPAGTRNGDGKDISGALGPYRWYVTDKPEEIAIILSRYAKEQRAINLAAEPVCAAQDYRPEWDVVLTSDDTEPVDNSTVTGDLPAERAGSDDLGKQGQSAAQDYRPRTTALKGRTKEDQAEEDQEEKQGASPDGSDAGRAAPARTGEASTAAAVDGPLGLRFEGQPQNAREADEALRWHGPGGLVGDNSPAARHARAAIVTGRLAPTREQRQRARARLNPAVREQVRAELAGRPAGLPRAAGLPLGDDQHRTGPTPPDPLAR